MRFIGTPVARAIVACCFLLLLSFCFVSLLKSLFKRSFLRSVGGQREGGGGLKRENMSEEEKADRQRWSLLILFRVFFSCLRDFLSHHLQQTSPRGDDDTLLYSFLLTGFSVQEREGVLYSLVVFYCQHLSPRKLNIFVFNFAFRAQAK